MDDGRDWRSSVQSFYDSLWGSVFCLPLQTGLASGAFTDIPMWHGAILTVSWSIRRDQLVLAIGNDPSGSDYRHGCWYSLRASPCSRLEHSHHGFAEWSSSDQLCTNDEDGFGSKSAPRFVGLFGWRGSAAPSNVCKFPVQPGRISGCVCSCARQRTRTSSRMTHVSLKAMSRSPAILRHFRT